MKIAISAQSNNEESLMDPRFGRARFIYVFDTDLLKGEFFNNEENINAAHGAGTQAAGLLIQNNVKAIISGSFGPKAYEVLKDVGIKMYKGDENKSVAYNIAQFQGRELEEITTAGESKHKGDEK